MLVMVTNLFVVFLVGVSVCCSYPKNKKMMFSSYIKEGKAHEARSHSLVTGLTPNMTSYAGYFTVDEQCDSNLFFWFFPSQNNPSTDPVSIWLQGGPGSSCLYGLLTELGPYNLKFDGDLEKREYSWNRNSSVIFIDNPVGTGFSYTGDLRCYATEQTQVGRDVLNALEQFFLVFPEYKSNEFFVTGESFGGHYVPAVAYAIHKSNSTINLKGIAIGSGWTDPENQFHYSELFYQLGLVDGKTRNEIAVHEENIRNFINHGQFHYVAEEEILLLDVFNRASGFSVFYNFLYPNGQPVADIDGFVIRKEVREALHVGDTNWPGVHSPVVYRQLCEDASRTVRPWLEELLDNYRVLIYNGQLDIIVAYALTERYLQKLNWTETEKYQAAERKLWHVNGELAGYAKSTGNFTEVLVRNAGHMVPTDQPVWALDMYNKFIFNKPIAS